MSGIDQRILCGIVFGIVTDLSMLPMRFDDKPAGAGGRIHHRFAIVRGSAQLRCRGRDGLSALAIGLLLRVPEAIVARDAFRRRPGAVGGTSIGWIIHGADP